MSLVSRLSLSTYLKNFFGVRGGYGPGVDESIAPVFDVATQDVVNDDLVTYWAFGVNTAAVAGQFGFAGFSPQNGGRLVIDRIVTSPSTASSRIQIGRQAAQLAAAYGNACIARNAGNFRSGPPGVRQGNQVAAPITGDILWTIELQVSPNPSQSYQLEIACKQGEEIIFAQNTVNVTMIIGVIGRFFGSFPE